MKNRGIALIEIVIGAAIISIGILTINSTYNTYVKYALANQRNIEAAYLLEEGLEIVGYIRDASWSNFGALSTTSTHYVTFTSTWATTSSPEYVDGIFQRSISVTDVFRDGGNDIAESGAFDPDARKVTVTVAYFQGDATTTKSLSSYLLNVFK